MEEGRIGVWLGKGKVFFSLLTFSTSTRNCMLYNNGVLVSKYVSGRTSSLSPTPPRYLNARFPQARTKGVLS